VTADCPLIDPDVIDRVIKTIIDDGGDYASNTMPRTYPRGLDVEAFTRGALFAAAAESHDPEDREHVTLFFHRHPDRFRRSGVVACRDVSRYRWTLDTSEDLEFLRRLFAAACIEPGHPRSFDDLLETIRAHPEIVAINAVVPQKRTTLEP
jgi:spore coat polysaccharide biosynthesis protein SpsF